MKKRKGIRILIILFSLTAAALFGVLLLRPVFTKLSGAHTMILDSGVPFSNSPLDKYDFTNCKINLSSYSHYNENFYLSKQQINDFIETLFGADINKYGISEIPEYVGGYDIYRVELENGENVDIYRVAPPYLVIGDKAYKCYSEDVLDFLDELADEIYKENYPDKNS